MLTDTYSAAFVAFRRLHHFLRLDELKPYVLRQAPIVEDTRPAGLNTQLSLHAGEGEETAGVARNPLNEASPEQKERERPELAVLIHNGLFQWHVEVEGAKLGEASRKKKASKRSKGATEEPSTASKPSASTVGMLRIPRLEIAKGKLTSLVGEVGSGKSSLLQAVSSLGCIGEGVSEAFDTLRCRFWGKCLS